MDRAADNWFESDSYWSAMFPFMFPETSFTAAADNVPKIAALTGVSAGNVLDLACGPGRYAIPLAKAGYQVTGVDRTRFLLQAARERAKGAGAEVEWVEEDMRTFIRPSAFDLALNVYTSFGYFDDPAENRRVLDNIFASLKPGGAFVFDHMGKELLAARFVATRSEAAHDGSLQIVRQSIIDDWSRTEAEWILLSEGTAKTFRIRHWLYSGREIRELFESVGFTEIALYGSLEGTAYGPGAQRLVAVARKPRCEPDSAANG
jgi:SAM-dependent methyltransferase